MVAEVLEDKKDQSKTNVMEIAPNVQDEAGDPD